LRERRIKGKWPESLLRALRERRLKGKWPESLQGSQANVKGKWPESQHEKLLVQTEITLRGL
jgi:hypothetical protein